MPRYRELYRGGSYLPKAYSRDVTQRVHRAVRRHGLHRAEAGEARQVPASPAEAEQLSGGAGRARQAPAAPAEQLTLL